MTKLPKNGKGIILMHDFQHATAEAMPELLRQLKAGGYKVVHMVPKAAGDDAREIRRHGAGAGQVLVQQQHAAGIERRPDDQRVVAVIAAKRRIACGIDRVDASQ